MSGYTTPPNRDQSDLIYLDQGQAPSKRSFGNMESGEPGRNRTLTHLSSPRGPAPEASGCCGMTKAGSIAFTVWMTATIALAIIGMLVCTGVLDVSFINVGPMTPDMGLYLMIAGLSGAVVGIVALMIAKCRCNKEQKEQIEGLSKRKSEEVLDPEESESGSKATFSQKAKAWHASNVKWHEGNMTKLGEWHENNIAQWQAWRNPQETD